MLSVRTNWIKRLAPALLGALTAFASRAQALTSVTPTSIAVDYTYVVWPKDDGTFWKGPATLSIELTNAFGEPSGHAVRAFPGSGIKADTCTLPPDALSLLQTAVDLANLPKQPLLLWSEVQLDFGNERFTDQGGDPVEVFYGTVAFAPPPPEMRLLEQRMEEVFANFSSWAWAQSQDVPDAPLPGA